jgi:hypothetical protein
MKRTILLFIGIFSLSCVSCHNLVFKDEKQVYPKNEFKDISEIEIYDYVSKKKWKITDSVKIESYVAYFKDSSNYFKNEMIKFNGVKSIYSIEFINNLDTLNFQIYPTEKNDKLEVGFLEPIKPGSDKWSWRKFNRFYLNQNLLDLIDKTRE